MPEQPTLALPHRVRQPRAAADAPPLLLLLHGYGSNEDDLIGLAPYLDPRLLIISARAPHTLMPGGYAWFELGFTPSGMTVDPAQAEASRALIVRFIVEVVTAYGADPARVLLCGFSQGAMMTAAVALSRPDLLSGAVLMSGMVPRDLLMTIAPSEQLAGFPMLMVHGLYDPVLPIEAGRSGRNLLAEMPVDLAYHEYPMAHEVSAESLQEVAGWITARLNAAP